MSAPLFRLNGCSFPVEEPHSFLEQLHGVLHCIEAAVTDEDGTCSLNSEILQSAVRGAQTLAHLVGQGLDYMDAKREGR